MSEIKWRKAPIVFTFNNCLFCRGPLLPVGLVDIVGYPRSKWTGHEWMKRSWRWKWIGKAHIHASRKMVFIVPGNEMFNCLTSAIDLFPLFSILFLSLAFIVIIVLLCHKMIQIYKSRGFYDSSHSLGIHWWGGRAFFFVIICTVLEVRSRVGTWQSSTEKNSLKVLSFITGTEL